VGHSAKFREGRSQKKRSPPERTSGPPVDEKPRNKESDNHPLLPLPRVGFDQIRIAANVFVNLQVEFIAGCDNVRRGEGLLLFEELFHADAQEMNLLFQKRQDRLRDGRLLRSGC
jgi:hypothetical protein